MPERVEGLIIESYSTFFLQLIKNAVPGEPSVWTRATVDVGSVFVRFSYYGAKGDAGSPKIVKRTIEMTQL
jgi:hypothetical protein